MSDNLTYCTFLPFFASALRCLLRDLRGWDVFCASALLLFAVLSSGFALSMFFFGLVCVSPPVFRCFLGKRPSSRLTEAAKTPPRLFLCLAEQASENDHYDVMQDNRRGGGGGGLELCHSVWPCFTTSLCMCMSVRAICRRTLPYTRFLCHRPSRAVCLWGFFVVVSFVSSVCDIVSRPDSAEGFSSCPSTGSRNEEKDWENDSTTSSTPSNNEYTGRRHACNQHIVWWD